MLCLGESLYPGCPQLPGPLCTPNLDGEVLGHHAVPGCQVSMHKLVGSKVGHAIRDLTSHLDHISQCWPWEPRVVLEPRDGLVKQELETVLLHKNYAFNSPSPF